MEQIGECLAGGLLELRREWEAKRGQFPELVNSINHLDELIRTVWGRDEPTIK
ncbi:MAG: hypothetical protein GTN76_07170 [Candidatus Aenigmarchaeota archaeon]|nr:hypothetical protein [Candidatus Aenigmarchaeota archaeon]